MTTKQKTIGACCLLTAAAIFFAVMSVWQYVEHKVPAIDAKPAAELNVPEQAVSETVTSKVAGFTVKGTAKADSGGSDSPAGGVSSSSSSSSSPKVEVTKTQKYRTNYDMAVRKSPDYDGEKAGQKDAGKEITIVETKTGTNNSVWGQMTDGNWICLSDNDYQYASAI